MTAKDKATSAQAPEEGLSAKAVERIALAFAKVNGHPNPEGYALEVALEHSGKQPEPQPAGGES